MPGTEINVFLRVVLKNTFPILFFLSLATSVSGQRVYWPEDSPNPARFQRYTTNPKDLRQLSIGGGFHYLYYFGAVSPASGLLGTDFNLARPGISFFMDYKSNPWLHLRPELLYGRIMGDDFKSADPNDPQSASLYVRNLSFRNDLLELSFAVQADLLNDFRPYYYRKRFNFYVFAGLAMLYQNPEGKVPEFKRDGSRFSGAGKWVALRPLGTEGQFSIYYDKKPYSNFQLVIPVGAGARFKVSQHLDVSLELGLRVTFTDYLDDVGSHYVDLGALNSDLARSMSDRSMEETAVVSGEKRNFEVINATTTEIKYHSKYKDAFYEVYRGYGQESNSAKRGGPSKDYYMSTSFKVSYILGKTSSYGKRK